MLVNSNFALGTSHAETAREGVDNRFRPTTPTVRGELEDSTAALIASVIVSSIQVPRIVKGNAAVRIAGIPYVGIKRIDGVLLPRWP